MNHVTLVSSEALGDHLADPRWVVIDCRHSLSDADAGERAYRLEHIPGARHAHLDRDLSAPPTRVSGRHPLPAREKLVATLGRWGVSRDSQVVVYDDAGGAFAARLWWLLRWLGHEAVAVLDGGWPQWLREGRITEAALPSPAAADFPLRPALASPVEVTELQTQLAGRNVLLIDARTPERFRGEVEPIDPVAGHVPGACNHPFQNNLDASGKFLSVDELRRQFLRRLGPIPPERAVHMCGSGVTACHNLLAMEHAGLHGARLYAGSWSEWIRDVKRPVAKGEAGHV